MTNTNLFLQLMALQKEKETLSAMQPQLAEGQLVEILQAKDQQIVILETGVREHQKESEAQEEKISR